MDNINGGELKSERVLCPRIELLGKFDLRKKKKNDGDERRYAWVMRMRRRSEEGNGVREMGRTMLG
jgi:hypothetical protein